MATLGGDWTTVELRFTSIDKRLHDGGDGSWDPRSIERISLGLSDGDAAIEIDDLRWILAP